MSLRLRLMVYYSSLLTILLIVFGMAVYGLLRWTMISQLDATLQRVVDDVLEDTQAAITPIPDGDEPQLTYYVPPLDTFRTPGVYVQIWESSDHNAPFSASENLSNYHSPLDAKAIDLEDDMHSVVEINGVQVRVLTKPIRVEGHTIGHVQTAASMATVQTALDRLLTILGGGSIIALALSLLLGDRLARHTLRPVASIVSSAQQITEGNDLDRRISYDGPKHDELGRIVHSFNETLARLERSFNSQKRFVGDVSHELRTPLTTIQGNLDLLRMYKDPEAIKNIQSEVERMSRMVEDLLLLAQVDSGQLPLKLERIELNRLLLEVYNESLLLKQESHQVHFEETDQLFIVGDADRLRQLFINLIANAIKFTSPQGEITMTLASDETTAHVLIRDSGIGIPQEDLAHIFERFYRVDKARTRAAGGVGLGLSIVHWIAEAHQGRIHVTSEMGRGTTFTIILPKETPPVTKFLKKTTT